MAQPQAKHLIIRFIDLDPSKYGTTHHPGARPTSDIPNEFEIDQNLQCSALKYTQPITMESCTFIITFGNDFLSIKQWRYVNISKFFSKVVYCSISDCSRSDIFLSLLIFSEKPRLTICDRWCRGHVFLCGVLQNIWSMRLREYLANVDKVVKGKKSLVHMKSKNSSIFLHSDMCNKFISKSPTIAAYVFSLWLSINRSYQTFINSCKIMINIWEQRNKGLQELINSVSSHFEFYQ